MSKEDETLLPNKITMRHFATVADEPSTWTMGQAQKVFRKLPAVIEALGMSPSALARSCGCDRRSIYRWMSGSGLSFYHAMKLAAVLQAKAQYKTEALNDIEWEDGLTEEERAEVLYGVD